MTILDRIIAHKRREVEQQKALVPYAQLARSPAFTRPVVSFTEALQRPGASGIIAEIKRASPSKGIIRQHINVSELAAGYAQAGASALSVLTDEEFFRGSLEDLRAARASVAIPLLRKDFIIDEYQIIAARASGADVILLIAAALTEPQIAALAAFARSLGLAVLLEIHAREELPEDLSDISAVGVNNRNLKDFTVDVGTSLALAEILPESVYKVSESGISNAATILRLKEAGFAGFLIGEAFMKHPRPQDACAELVQQISWSK